MCFESKMWFQSNQEEDLGMNLDDEFVNYDDFPSFAEEEGVGGRGGSEDYTNVMEELLNMNLIGADAVWDPALISCQGLDEMEFLKRGNDGDEKPALRNEGGNHLGERDLHMVFYEWLKSNKELISAEDLRSIKLKKATIESAVKRLGEGKLGMKRLLQLILEWVQNHQLVKKRIKEEKNSSYHMGLPQYQNQNPNPNPDLNSHIYSMVSMPQWTHHQQTYISESTTTVYPPMMYGYVDECFYNNGALRTAPTWPPPNSTTHYIDFSDQNHSPPPLSPRVVPPAETMSFMSSATTITSQLYPNNPNDRVVKSGMSSTKEARMHRMARQKRVFSNGRSYIDHRHEQVHETRLANESNCTNTSQHPNWQLHWPSSPSPNSSPSTSTVRRSESPPPRIPIQEKQPSVQPQQYQEKQPSVQPQQYQQQSSPERQPVCHTDPGNNLKFLMQKVLKQTDVGSLGRIVLPKKEAEAFLPNVIGSREGIIIAVEDAGTAQTWKMRYRSWPNNKNRMYMLENTGEFVRSNGLREGDFIVIYSHMKCDKFLIRGVKVGHLMEPEAPKRVKAHGYHHRNSSSSSAKRTMW